MEGCGSTTLSMLHSNLDCRAVLMIRKSQCPSVADSPHSPTSISHNVGFSLTHVLAVPSRLHHPSFRRCATCSSKALLTMKSSMGWSLATTQADEKTHTVLVSSARVGISHCIVPPLLCDDTTSSINLSTASMQLCTPIGTR